MDVFFTLDGLIALMTLTFLEIVLGIDNIIFISLVTDKLPQETQGKARFVGLSLALVMRVALLFGVTWLMSSDDELFQLFHHSVSLRDIIVLAGGLFLIGKSTSEIGHKLRKFEEGEKVTNKKKVSFSMIIVQIVLLDLVFSFDSILTAVGMVKEIQLMIAAVIISLIIMMVFSEKISNFINKHHSLQILALSFLILIGFMLVLESVGTHVEKGYIYFAVFFSLIVELVNMQVRKRKQNK